MRRTIDGLWRQNNLYEKAIGKIIHKDFHQAVLRLSEIPQYTKATIDIIIYINYTKYN